MNKSKAESFEIPGETKEKWQKIIEISAAIIGVPAGLIMQVIEEDISVFLSSKTENNPYKPGDREHLIGSGLYCETVISTKQMLLVPHAPSDEKWKDNPDIKLNMISYLGFPINMPDGEPFGTICVLDNRENHYSQTYISLIENFREIIEKDIELLWMNHTLGETNKQLSDYITEIQTLRGIIPICSKCKKVRDDKGYWNQLEEYMEEHSQASFSHGLCEECAEELYGNEEWFKNSQNKE